MTEKRLITVGLFALLLLSLPARADSDGCYCASKGYIAYELRAAIRKVLDPNGDPLNAPHVLRIVRLNQGIREAGEVTLPDFQVHELRCDADSITIAGVDKVWLKYVVDISQPGQLRIAEHVEEPFEQHPIIPGSVGPAQMNGFSPDQVLNLISTSPEDTYQLVITHSRKAYNSGTDTRQRGFEFDNRAELRRLDSRGSVLQRVLLYQDHFTEIGDYSQ
jgi:hypothetical protein